MIGCYVVDRNVMESRGPLSIGLDDPSEALHAVDWDFPRSSSRDEVHPYPARFIPEIPRAAIPLLQTDGPILDPFCGSGTTLVEAQRLGHEAIGLDINPIACLISRVKVGVWSDDDASLLETHARALVASAARGDEQ